MGQLLEGEMEPIYPPPPPPPGQQPQQQNPPTPTTTTTTAALDDDTPVDYTNYYFTCRQCAKPVMPFKHVLAKQIGTWSKTVFSYQLEDVLPTDETGAACYVYSATNPGQHRFDVFRVKVDPEEDGWSALTLQIDSSRGFTPSHSWFPGYSWNMVGCGHCSAHLGWGFSPTRKSDHELSAGDDDDDDDAGDGGAGGGGGGGAEAENNNNNDRRRERDDDDQAEEKEDDDAAADNKDENEEDASAAAAPRHPEFIGVIFSNIRHKELQPEEWQSFLANLNSVIHRSRLIQIREAWPALHDSIRRMLLNDLKRVMQLAQSEDSDLPAAGVRSQIVGAILPMLFNRYAQILATAAAFTQRVRQRQRNGEAIEQHQIPMLRMVVEDDYEPLEEEKEEVAEKIVLAASQAESNEESSGAAAASAASSESSMSKRELYERTVLHLLSVFVERWDSIVPAVDPNMVNAAAMMADDDDDDDEEEDVDVDGDGAFDEDDDDDPPDVDYEGLMRMRERLYPEEHRLDVAEEERRAAAAHAGDDGDNDEEQNDDDDDNAVNAAVNDALDDDAVNAAVNDALKDDDNDDMGDNADADDIGGGSDDDNDSRGGDSDNTH